jgi:hypothetical protein
MQEQRKDRDDRCNDLASRTVRVAAFHNKKRRNSCIECSNENQHYAMWRSVYLPYLVKYYDILISNLYKECPQGIQLEDFCQFVYSFSSGYITPYI